MRFSTLQQHPMIVATLQLSCIEGHSNPQLKQYKHTFHWGRCDDIGVAIKTHWHMSCDISQSSIISKHPKQNIWSWISFYSFYVIIKLNTHWMHFPTSLGCCSHLSFYHCGTQGSQVWIWKNITLVFEKHLALMIMICRWMLCRGIIDN
jgi:hypothetical protein